MNGLWGRRPEGDEIITLYGIAFSGSGLRIGTLLALRVVIIVVAGMLFTMSSPPSGFDAESDAAALPAPGLRLCCPGYSEQPF